MAEADNLREIAVNLSELIKDETGIDVRADDIKLTYSDNKLRTEICGNEICIIELEELDYAADEIITNCKIKEKLIKIRVHELESNLGAIREKLSEKIDINDLDFLIDYAYDYRHGEMPEESERDYPSMFLRIMNGDDEFTYPVNAYSPNDMIEDWPDFEKKVLEWQEAK